MDDSKRLSMLNNQNMDASSIYSKTDEAIPHQVALHDRRAPHASYFPYQCFLWYSPTQL